MTRRRTCAIRSPPSTPTSLRACAHILWFRSVTSAADKRGFFPTRFAAHSEARSDDVRHGVASIADTRRVPREPRGERGILDGPAPRVRWAVRDEARDELTFHLEDLRRRPHLRRARATPAAACIRERRDPIRADARVASSLVTGRRPKTHRWRVRRTEGRSGGWRRKRLSRHLSSAHPEEAATMTRRSRNIGTRNAGQRKRRTRRKGLCAVDSRATSSKAAHPRCSPSRQPSVPFRDEE